MGLRMKLNIFIEFGTVVDISNLQDSEIRAARNYLKLEFE